MSKYLILIFALVYKRTECGPSLFCSSRAAAANAGQQSVERAPGSQQKPTFDGFDSPEKINLVCKKPQMGL